MFVKDFERHRRRAGHLERPGRFHHHPVRDRIVRVLVERLFGQGQRLGRVFAQCQLRPRQQRRDGGVAERFLEKTAAGFLPLGSAQRATTLEQARLAAKHLTEQVNRVIKVLARKRVVRPLDQQPHIPRNVRQALLRHGDSM